MLLVACPQLLWGQAPADPLEAVAATLEWRTRRAQPALIDGCAIEEATRSLAEWPDELGERLGNWIMWPCNAPTAEGQTIPGVRLKSVTLDGDTAAVELLVLSAGGLSHHESWTLHRNRPTDVWRVVSMTEGGWLFSDPGAAAPRAPDLLVPTLRVLRRHLQGVRLALDGSFLVLMPAGRPTAGWTLVEHKLPPGLPERRQEQAQAQGVTQGALPHALSCALSAEWLGGEMVADMFKRVHPPSGIPTVCDEAPHLVLALSDPTPDPFRPGRSNVGVLGIGPWGAGLWTVAFGPGAGTVEEAVHDATLETRLVIRRQR